MGKGLGEGMLYSWSKFAKNTRFYLICQQKNVRVWLEWGKEKGMSASQHPCMR
jgi:hypothetical protein